MRNSTTANGEYLIFRMIEGIAQGYLKYKKAGIPAELHIYSNVGHGFGLRKSNKGPVSQWPQRFVDWINEVVLK